MFCKNCGSEIDDKAVVCTKCGVAVQKTKKKKSLFKRWWFWVIVGVLLIGIVAGSSGGDSTSNNTPAGNNPSENVEIVYEQVDLRTMLDELDANALKAEKTYQDKYVEVRGKIANFDSDGSYISIEPVNADGWNFTTVMCYIKNDEQLNFLLDKSVGDTVTVQGKITSVGEILGYSLNIATVK